MVCFILFQPQETKLDEKGTPWSLLWSFRLSKHENTKWSCTSSGSLNPRISETMKHYFLFFQSLLKNEERSKLTFLDSLKFNKKDKEEVLFLGYKRWQHVFFEHSTLWTFRYSCFSVHFHLGYYFEFLTPPLVLYT